MISIELTKEATDLIRRLLKVLSPGELFGGIVRLYQKVAPKAAGHITKQGLSGQLLKVRTGSLRRAIVGAALLSGGIPAIRVGIFQGPALAYAGIHEYGTSDVNSASPYAAIVPKDAKALAMPTREGQVLTPAGVPRIDSPRQYRARFGEPLQFIPFNNDKVVGGLYDSMQLLRAQLAARQDGREFSLRDVVAQFLLLKQTSLRPRRYLYAGMVSYLPTIAAETVMYLRDVLNGRRTV